MQLLLLIMSHPCDFPGCFKTFHNLGALDRHRSTQHKSVVNENYIGAAGPSGTAIVEERASVVTEAAQLPHLGNQRADTACIASTMMDWELEHRVPPTVKQRQKKDVEKLYQEKLKSLQTYVDNALIGCGAQTQITLTECPGISTFFPDVLKTIHRERTYAKLELGVVQHEVLHLGTSEVSIGYNDSEQDVQVVQSNDECIIFPFAETVKQVLTKEELYESMEIFRRERSTTSNTTIDSFYEGHEWKTHPFFVRHRGAYSLVFYWDDVTLTNPIGHYKRKVDAHATTTPLQFPPCKLTLFLDC